MDIEEREKEFVVSFSKADFTRQELEDFLAYLKFRRLTAGIADVPQEQIDQLAEEINKDYVTKHKYRFPFLK